MKIKELSAHAVITAEHEEDENNLPKNFNGDSEDIKTVKFPPILWVNH